MRRTRFTKFTSSLVALTHLVFSVLVVMPSMAHAQGADTEPPVIELETVAEGVRGETQVFSATVTDNDQISSMTLHYRFGSDAAYIAAPMSVIQGTSIYTASIDTKNTTASVIQYYMEAKDAGGNRSVQAFAFDPFERTLLDEKVVVSDAAAAGSVVPVVAPSRSTTRKIAYGLLALLVVGGLASAGSSSSSSSVASGDGNSAGSGEVELTIVVDKFQ